jgi:serine/threonine protein kinase
MVELIRKSGLLEPAKLDGYLTTHKVPDDAPAELVMRMQADGLITPFHAGQLLKGKWRGFFLGKYKLLDRIGFGGMGQVFLAEHGAMRRRVAIKVLPPDRAENEFSRERFLREARAIGQLDHPNLVRAFDVDSDAGVFFLVMEFVDGVSFHDLVTKHGPVDPARAAHFLWQAAHGLAYLSANHLVHRDIKPANLLVDRQGTVKILDLGLVRSAADTENDLTRQEGVKILGTADYLAPEQAVNCSAVDVRADIYSLGATGYFLLTGRPPFGGDKVAHKLIAHQVQAVQPVHEVNPNVPPELSDVISKMLAKKPANRYQTPGELLAALEPWAASPQAPPGDHEIPTYAGVGSPASTVNLGLSGLRASRASGSGSGIRFHTDSNLLLASRLPPAVTSPTGKTPPPVPPAAPPPPAAEPAGLPPVLPAKTTYAPVAAPAAPPNPADLVPVFLRSDPPAPSATARKSSRTTWVLIACGLLVAIIGSASAVLAGAVR